MSIEKVGFVGFRSSDLNGFRRVLEEGLEMRATDVAADQVGYLLPDGTRLEVYGDTNEFHSFFTTGPVVGLAVADFDHSWERLKRLGIQPITDIQQDKGRRWVHFRMPDGTIAELIGGSPPSRKG
jgi:hypothetical protein